VKVIRWKSNALRCRNELGVNQFEWVVERRTFRWVRADCKIQRICWMTSGRRKQAVVRGKKPLDGRKK